MRFLFLLMLASCASMSTRVAYTPPQVDPSYATVLFVQQGAFMSWRFLDTKRYIGQTERGAYFEARLPAGKHRIYAYHPDGSAWADDGFCHGIDADLEAGKLYVVLVRWISPANNRLDEVGAELSDYSLKNAAGATDLHVSFRPLTSRAQLGMDPSGYFKKLVRLEPDLAEGQREHDAWVPTIREKQKDNIIWKLMVEQGNLKWENLPMPCEKANNNKAIAATDNFPIEDFHRKAGKKITFLEKNEKQIHELATKECGAGVDYAVLTRSATSNYTTLHRVSEGAYDVTYKNTGAFTINGGDIICDGGKEGTFDGAQKDPR